MMSGDSETRRIVIMGAAGRDFHNFNVVYRDDPEVQVVAFTATQIPDIEGRRYPAVLAGEGYPDCIPIHAESEMEALIESGERRAFMAHLAEDFTAQEGRMNRDQVRALPDGVRGAHEASVRDAGTHEQAAASGEQNPMLPRRELDHLLRGARLPLKRIESEQA